MYEIDAAFSKVGVIGSHTCRVEKQRDEQR